VFQRRDKLYVADFSIQVAAVTRAYMKVEEAESQAGV
jgi:hypothetical protein